MTRPPNFQRSVTCRLNWSYWTKIRFLDIDLHNSLYFRTWQAPGLFSTTSPAPGGILPENARRYTKQNKLPEEVLFCQRGSWQAYNCKASASASFLSLYHLALLFFGWRAGNFLEQRSKAPAHLLTYSPLIALPNASNDPPPQIWTPVLLQSSITHP